MAEVKQRQHASLTETVNTFREYKQVLAGLDEALEVVEDKSLDEEFREMAQEELKELKERKEELEEQLHILLLPKDPNDEKNVIVEIRGGAGGDEAALFAGDLFRMYTKYAEAQGWRCEIIDANAPELGGFKEVVFSVDGNSAYSKLKFEKWCTSCTARAGNRIVRSYSYLYRYRSRIAGSGRCRH